MPWTQQPSASARPTGACQVRLPVTWTSSILQRQVPAGQSRGLPLLSHFICMVFANDCVCAPWGYCCLALQANFWKEQAANSCAALQLHPGPALQQSW